MKLRYRFILCCVFCWVAPWVADADSTAELIEQFPLGQINWTRGVIAAKGVVAPQSMEHNSPSNLSTPSPAFEQAVQNVVNTLKKLRVDHQRCAAQLFADNESIWKKIEAMARSSKVVHTVKTPAGGEEIFVQMSLYGGFAQLMLPSEIRQVQPIKPLNRTPFPTRGPKPDMGALVSYTGLIVDARGTGAKPSMVPKLLDEKGYEVFGPAYVSREFAVQYGICQYIRMVDGELMAQPRVGPQPLVVKGLRPTDPESCHIIISNADASKLRGTSTHLNFLKKCRVMIVLD